MSETSDLIRENFKKSDDIRDAGLTSPEDVVRFDDIVYGQDAKWQILDVYRPKAEEGKKLPVIVSVHGGGWVYGDKERYQYYCMNLAQRGFAVVNFTYRLAPENKFPASLEDTNLVFTWVLQNAEKYGFDTKHVFAVGDSAGAHILGLYIAMCTNEKYASEYSFKVPEGFVPTAAALNCGKYEINLEGDLTDEQTRLLMADFLPEKGNAKEQELINVTKHVTEKYPPVFVMTATGDFLKEQAPLMAAKLSSQNVPFIYRLYGDAQHKLGHVFHCDVRSEDARICNNEECDFFKEFVKE
ncbi:MAG: alpha/beta hydrolase [Roseburia sp.]|nr:alpha/beta hydrolase [Roseburia sp.]MCM1241224.1 alpha/beta hydrolase [Roseburia sp.]